MTDAEILRHAAYEIRQAAADTAIELSVRSGATYRAEFYACEAARRYDEAADEADQRAEESARN